MEGIGQHIAERIKRAVNEPVQPDGHIDDFPI
jgi:hypothetical protein